MRYFIIPNYIIYLFYCIFIIKDIDSLEALTTEIYSLITPYNIVDKMK